MSEKVPTTVVLGVGADGKPHASRFQERDAPFVARAAALMGFHVITVSPENDELHGIAAALPLGKIFATGRAFVPFVSRSRFDKLAPLSKPPANGRWNRLFAWDECCGGKHAGKIDADG
jgi:hypothetical protein